MSARRVPHCGSLVHPRGEVTGPVVRVTPRATYQHRMCPVCGKSQGIARFRTGLES